MERIITYHIDRAFSGMRIEQYLRRLGYSYQNLTQLKKNAREYSHQRDLVLYENSAL